MAYWCKYTQHTLSTSSNDSRLKYRVFFLNSIRKGSPKEQPVLKRKAQKSVTFFKTTPH